MKKTQSGKSKSTKEIENCLEYYEIRIKRSCRDPKFVLEIAGFVVLTAYAIFTILMYFANNRAANAATSAADTAGKTLTNSQQQFRMEQRPYLSPVARGGYYNPKDNTRGTFHIGANGQVDSWAVAVEIQNVGKSPAVEVTNTRTLYKVGLAADARREAQNYVPEYPTVGQIVTPGSSVTPPSDASKITVKEFQEVGVGTREIYVVGAVQYRDMFDSKIPPYETTYCFKVLTTGLPFANCDFRPPAFHTSIK